MGNPSCLPTSVSRFDLVAGKTFTIGRSGDIELGVRVPSLGISRVALAVMAASDGWWIVDRSRNGAVILPWGLAPIRAINPTQLRWPLTAIRILVTSTQDYHWVLLECSGYFGASHRRTSSRRQLSAETVRCLSQGPKYPHSRPFSRPTWPGHLRTDPPNPVS